MRQGTRIASPVYGGKVDFNQNRFKSTETVNKPKAGTEPDEWLDLKAVSEYLSGATLQIVDADGNVVEEWVSGDEPHRIEMFAPGWYMLVETMAPEGYLVANDVRFEVLATGEVQTVVMSDEPAPAPEEPGKGLAQTGDSVPVWIFALIGVLACGVATVALATHRGGMQRLREKLSTLIGGRE